MELMSMSSRRRSSASKTAARARARQRRILLDAERALRDEAIEEAASQFFQFSDHRDQLREQIAELEARMATPISQLVELGEPQRRIAQLLDLTVEEVRHLRAAGKPKNSGEAEGVEGEHARA